MAKLKVFSVFDSKAEAYLQPFYCSTVGQATRMMVDAVANPQHAFARHLGDYTLFLIAEFDESTGALVNYPNYMNLGTALEFHSRSNTLGGTDETA